MGGAAGCGEEVVGGVGGVEGFSDSGKEGWGWGGVTAVLLRRTTRDKW